VIYDGKISLLPLIISQKSRFDEVITAARRAIVSSNLCSELYSPVLYCFVLIFLLIWGIIDISYHTCGSQVNH